MPLLADAVRFGRHAPGGHVERYANNPIESDHAQLNRWLHPMRGLRTERAAQVIIVGPAFRYGTVEVRQVHPSLDT
jgi:hypothetical protein